MPELRGLSTGYFERQWKGRDIKSGLGFCPNCTAPALREKQLGGFRPVPFKLADGVSLTEDREDFVCLPCRIWFRQEFYVLNRTCETGKCRITDISFKPIDKRPLVVFGDELLTPDGVAAEEYKKEHGEYPPPVMIG